MRCAPSAREIVRPREGLTPRKGVFIGETATNRPHVQSDWNKAMREKDWQLETPTSVRTLVRQNPVGALFWLLVLCVFGLAFAVGSHLPNVLAVPLGIVGAAAIWWLLMLGFAKGWIHDE